MWLYLIIEYPFTGDTLFYVHAHFYTLAEGILISVKSLQRSEGDVSDPVKYVGAVRLDRWKQLKPQDRMVRKNHGSIWGVLRDVRRCLLNHFEIRTT